MTDQAGQEKRCGSEGVTFYPLKLRGSMVVSHCHGQCDDYLYPACTLTAETISYPVTGPVGNLCPLPDYGNGDGAQAEKRDADERG